MSKEYGNVSNLAESRFGGGPTTFADGGIAPSRAQESTIDQVGL